MTYILKLENIKKTDKTAGIRGCVLGELIHYGIPVPEGFVITCEGYVKFLKTNNIDSRLEEVFKTYEADISKVSYDIQNLIMNASIPEFLAKGIKDAYEELSVGKDVKNIGGIALDMIKAGRGNEIVCIRPSIVLDSKPVGQKTFLNITGFTHLLNSIKEVWASSFNEHALIYRNLKNLPASPLISIVVQKMIESEKSGVISTLNPITSKEEMIIECGWGLGDILDSGMIIPDIYFISKDTGEIKDKRIGKKTWVRKKDPATGSIITESVYHERINAPVLCINEIRKLWMLAKKIEEILGAPQIIEWGIERGKIFILDSYPLKTNFQESAISNGKEILTGIPCSCGKGEGKITTEMENVKDGSVLLTGIPSLDILKVVRKVCGVITDYGGIFSKGAIICREFGIPMVCGTEKATNILKETQEVLIDGTDGRIFKKEPSISITHASIDLDEIPATQIYVKTNSRVSGSKIDGIIFEPEHILASSEMNPYSLSYREPEKIIQVLESAISESARTFSSGTFWYKGFDLESDKMRGLEASKEEPNPLLGWHGIRRNLEDSRLIECELKALKRVSSQGFNVGYLIPFISDIEELKKFKFLVDFPLKIGIIVEIPSAALEIKKFCEEGIDMVYINLDKLSSLVTGTDIRNSFTFSKLHSSVLKLLKEVISTCKTYGIKTYCGGKILNFPEEIENLIILGCKGFIVEEEFLEDIRSAVLKAEKSILLEKIRKA